MLAQPRLLASLLLLLAACAQQPEPERKPQRAGEPVPVVETAARIAVARGAGMVGNDALAREQIDGISDDVRRAMKLPDHRRPIDREAARTTVRALASVRSVVWLDQSNLLVMVNDSAARSYATIDTICLALEPLGDTLAVVVNLQNASARNGDELEILSRNCQLAPGDRAFLQPNRQVDVLSPELRAEVRAQQPAGPDDADRKRKADEAARILDRSTTALGESKN